MYTPSKGTRPPLHPETDPQKHHHKCVCEICTCGMATITKESTAVHLSMSHLKAKQHTIIITSLTKLHVSNSNEFPTIPNNATTTPISSKPHIKPTTLRIPFIKFSLPDLWTATCPQEVSFRTRLSTRSAMCPIK